LAFNEIGFADCSAPGFSKKIKAGFQRIGGLQNCSAVAIHKLEKITI